MAVRASTRRRHRCCVGCRQRPHSVTCGRRDHGPARALDAGPRFGLNVRCQTKPLAQRHAPAVAERRPTARFSGARAAHTVRERVGMPDAASKNVPLHLIRVPPVPASATERIMPFPGRSARPDASSRPEVGRSEDDVLQRTKQCANAVEQASHPQRRSATTLFAQHRPARRSMAQDAHRRATLRSIAQCRSR